MIDTFCRAITSTISIPCLGSAQSRDEYSKAFQLLSFEVYYNTIPLSSKLGPQTFFYSIIPLGQRKIFINYCC